MLTELLEKFAIGSHLTDEELETLHTAYQAVVSATAPFGQRYELVRFDAVLKLEVINSYIRARKKNG